MQVIDIYVTCPYEGPMTGSLYKVETDISVLTDYI